MLAFLTPLLSRAGLTMIAVALAVAAIGLQTLRLDHAKADLAKARVAQAVAKREDAAKTIASGISAKTDVARVEIQWRTKTLIEKVPTYVPAAADADCRVPVGFVRLHDAAAAGLPTPAGGPEPAASGVQLSAVAATVIGNYGIAYGWREEALAWRDWYVAEKAAWEKR